MLVLILIMAYAAPVAVRLPPCCRAAAGAVPALAALLVRAAAALLPLLLRWSFYAALLPLLLPLPCCGAGPGCLV